MTSLAVMTTIKHRSVSKSSNIMGSCLLTLLLITPLFVPAQRKATSKSKVNATAKDLVSYVNTLQGTNSNPGYSTGNTYPPVALPFAVNFWSPQTGKNGDGWKYQYKATTIRGFGQTHQCSPWMNDYGVFTLMPLTGKLEVDENKRASSFQHKNEQAGPDYYSVRFDNGVQTEITPTTRGADFRFSFPGSASGFLLLDGYIGLSDFKIYPKERKVTGFVKNGLFIPGNFKNYIILEFNQPFEAYGSWDGKTAAVAPGQDSVLGEKKGIYLQFKKGSKLDVKVASSYISHEQVARNFDQELKGKTFDQIRSSARQIWNKELSKVVVEGGTKEQMETFYSCLFRASLFPCKFYDRDEKGDPYYYSPNDGNIHKGYFYTDDGYWDTFRAKFPLYNILQPEMQGRYMNAILAVKRECGWLPSWSFPGETGGVMIGNHAISLLADAWMKGIHTFNPDSALSYYLHEVRGSAPDGRYGRKDWGNYFVLGYIPYKDGEVGSTAKTLEYCYDDFCAYQLAKATGNTYYEQIFARQLYNYRNVFNPATNFMQGRDADGKWSRDFNPYKWGGPFVEGNAWHYTWSIFHDVQGLIDLMGGRKAFTDKIDALFQASDSVDVGTYGNTIHEMSEMVAAKMGQYAQGNEPIEHLPYLYSYAGQPWKTQYHVRQIVDKLFNAGPNGYPGDEDQGQMSSWYVLSALGIYSVCPGTTQYVIGSPLFKKATLRLENGHQFVIETQGGQPGDVYIQSATLNGKPFTANWIDYGVLMQGGHLIFRMGAKPAMDRGTAAEDLPYSLTPYQVAENKK